MRRLGVNIDHVATIRNARGEHHPDPLSAAKFVNKVGADSITIHLREDRRHIKDSDAKKICSNKRLLVNLEISTNLKIVKLALKIKPNFICIVPENRKEITTEGGLNLKKNKIRKGTMNTTGINLNWMDGDMEVVLPMMLCLIGFSTFWGVSKLKIINNGSVKNILFTKYWGLLTMGILPAIIALYLMPQYSL